MPGEQTPAIDQVSRDGLTAGEVEQRRSAGNVNRSDRRTSRSIGEIVRANVLTRFNAIIAVLAVVVLIFGSPIDALFALVMVLNAAIGVIQEVRAKRSLDRLTILIAPKVLVVRDGAEQEIDPSHLVIDDLVRLRAGDEVPVDALVVDSDGLEVDESALTGEAEAVVKDDGDEVLSGSAVVSGSGLIVATRVGRERWIEGLVAEAREFVLTSSELRVGVDQILKVISWLIVPLGALSVWSQLRSDQDFDEAMVSSVAAIVGLVPQGLVLLVSMAMAVATLRLGRNQVVVQELYAVEGLARIDVLCVDKTGTLTTGRFELDDVLAFDDDVDSMRAGLGALVHAEGSPTASSKVIAESIECPEGWQPVSQVAFSSARKWSATSFDGKGTWVMGAPEVLLDAVGTDADSSQRQRVSELAADARRVLLVAKSDAAIGDGHDLPGDLSAVGLVVLVEQLRSDAGEIMEYFAAQHVAVKIISGDSSETVSAVAGRLGIAGGDRHVDLRHVEEGAYDAVVDESIVFGRVRPEQKRDLVDALQTRRSHRGDDRRRRQRHPGAEAGRHRDRHEHGDPGHQVGGAARARRRPVRSSPVGGRRGPARRRQHGTRLDAVHHQDRVLGDVRAGDRLLRIGLPVPAAPHQPDLRVHDRRPCLPAQLPGGRPTDAPRLPASRRGVRDPRRTARLGDRARHLLDRPLAGSRRIAG